MEYLGTQLCKVFRLENPVESKMVICWWRNYFEVFIKYVIISSIFAVEIVHLIPKWKWIIVKRAKWVERRSIDWTERQIGFIHILTLNFDIDPSALKMGGKKATS